MVQLRPLAEQQENKQENTLYEDKKIKKEIFEFINHLVYHNKYQLNWLEYNKVADEKVEQRFTHITNITITKKNVRKISSNGRMRWLIENQGFNTQKNSGFKLQHKYSRKYYFSMQNYYHLLQIAHMIMQLVEKLEHIKQQLKASVMTIVAAVDDMVSTMTKECITQEEFVKEFNQTKQLRYTDAR